MDLKTWLKIACGLALLIGLLGIGERSTVSAHPYRPLVQAPQESCKQLHQVAVVVKTGEQFQRICVPEAQERTLNQVRAICNYTQAVVFFEDDSIQKYFDLFPEQCQLFDLDDGDLIT